MRILLVQHDPRGGDPVGERKRLARRLEPIPPQAPELILFPELASTGFHPEMPETAELRLCFSDDRAFYAELARVRGAWVLAGILEARGGLGRWRNLAVLFDPQGTERGCYEKIHPFSYTREHETFSSGSRCELWPVEGFKLQPAVCYDLRFPELFRAQLDSGVNVYAVLANWPEPRRHHWEQLLAARAIENQAFVLAVNCAGTVFGTPYAGGSRILNPRGELVCVAGIEPGVTVGSIDPEEVRRWRDEFPALRDRKPGGYRAQAL